MAGIREFVDGKHYFDTFADDAVFESRYHFPGWPTMIRGRADLVSRFNGYGETISSTPATHLLRTTLGIVAL
jgi:uncharacterized protein